LAGSEREYFLSLNRLINEFGYLRKYFQQLKIVLFFSEEKFDEPNQNLAGKIGGAFHAPMGCGCDPYPFEQHAEKRFPSQGPGLGGFESKQR
jgi:hypothetical protein